MSLCERAVALWLAACALAARAQAERVGVLYVSPRCLHHNCSWWSTLDDLSTFEYVVNGEHLKIRADKKSYYADCDKVALDDPAWPAYQKPQHFHLVALTYCALNPPALKALNVTYDVLSLMEVPASSISVDSITELPVNLEALELMTASKAILREPIVLERFVRLRVLKLKSYFVDPVPSYLDSLSLWDTGIETLPQGAQSLSSLTIFQEDQLKFIHLRNPRLHSLTLVDLTALTSLVLHEVSDELLTEGLVENCTILEELEFRQVHARTLPDELLRDAVKMTSFTFTGGFLEQLPQGLFSYSKRLQIIDLSDNGLDSLPSDVFTKLPELRILRLSNNRLNSWDLSQIIEPLKTLNLLDLNDNPLEEYCKQFDPFESMPELRELHLARTRTPKYCSYWLDNAKSLRYIDLRGNSLHEFSCSEKYSDHENISYTLIDMRDNPITPFYCPFKDNEFFGLKLEHEDSTPIKVIMDH